MLRQLALRHQLGIPLPPPCPVPAPFPTMLRLRHGAIPSLPLVVAVALPDRGTQLHETEEPLVTRPRQDPTLATNGKFGQLLSRGRNGCVGIWRLFVRYRQRLLGRKASRLRRKPCC